MQIEAADKKDMVITKRTGIAKGQNLYDAKSRGITAISLEATDMGRPLYEKYGFVKLKDEMELPI